MKQLIKIVFTTLAVTISTSAYAQDTFSNINESDIEQLQQMACSTDYSSNTQQTSFEEIESTLTQTLSAYGIDFSDEQIQSAYSQALEMTSGLEVDNTLQQFCDT